MLTPPGPRSRLLGTFALAGALLGLVACHRTPLRVDRQTPGTDAAAEVRGDASDARVEPPLFDPALGQFLRDFNDAFYGSWSRCFNTPRSLWPSDDVSDLPAASFNESVRLGLMAMDEAAAQRCLAALETAPCEVIVDLSSHGLPLVQGVGLPACAGVFVGQVAPGQTCLVNEDCRSPKEYACAGQGTCGRICTTRASRALGDVCGEADRCPEGSECRFGPRNLFEMKCLAPTAEGGACREDAECASGLRCSPPSATSLADGTCRPLALGTPCAGNWECPRTYVCAGPVYPGTCQLGKSVGAPCTDPPRGHQSQRLLRLRSGNELPRPRWQGREVHRRRSSGSALRSARGPRGELGRLSRGLLRHRSRQRPARRDVQTDDRRRGGLRERSGVWATEPVPDECRRSSLRTCQRARPPRELLQFHWRRRVRRGPVLRAPRRLR